MESVTTHGIFSQGGRILIGLAPLPRGEMSIRTAVNFAGVTNREIVAVFVHEESLLNIIKLPITPVVDSKGELVASKQKQLMLKEIDRMARQYARSMEDEATKRNVKWKFSQSDGKFAQSLNDHQSEGDLLVVPGSYYRDHANEFINLLENLPPDNPALIVIPDRQYDTASNHVAILLSGDSGDKTRLELGVQLATGTGGKLIILIAGNSLNWQNSPEQLLQSRLDHHPVSPSPILHSIEYIAQPGPINLVSYINHNKPLYAVLNAHSPHFYDSSAVSYYFRLIRCPIILLQ